MELHSALYVNEKAVERKEKMMLKQAKYALIATTMLVPAGTALAETDEKPLSSYKDGAPVALSGTVTEVRSDEFDLSYGTGSITVELGDWNWFENETQNLVVGDEVIVSGKIDDDLFEGREVKADNLYVRQRYAYYFVDNAYPSYYMTSVIPLEDPDTESQNNDDADSTADRAYYDGNVISMRGTVSEIKGDEFTLTNSDDKSLTVDVSGMAYDPFDDTGWEVEAGDRIQVYGHIDDDLFEKREINATSIVTLSEAKTKTSQKSDGETQKSQNMN